MVGMRTMVRRLVNFARLEPRDRGMVVAAAAGLVLVRMGVRFAPYRRVTQVLERVPRARQTPPQLSARRLAAIVDAASAAVPDATCLTQALVLHALLKRHGYDSRVCIGVNRGASGAIAGHAWVERDGIVLLGGVDAPNQYLPLAVTASAESPVA